MPVPPAVRMRSKYVTPPALGDATACSEGAEAGSWLDQPEAASKIELSGRSTGKSRFSVFGVAMTSDGTPHRTHAVALADWSRGLPRSTWSQRSPALAVRVADLGDRGHADGVDDAPAPAQRQPENLAAAGGDLDRAVLL